MWVKASASGANAERQTRLERSRASQRGDDPVGLGRERLGVLEWSARRPERHAAPARQKVEVQMEDLLSARGFVELLYRKSFRLHAGHHRAPDLLHRRYEAAEVSWLDVEQR